MVSIALTNLQFLQNKNTRKSFSVTLLIFGFHLYGKESLYLSLCIFFDLLLSVEVILKEHPPDQLFPLPHEDAFPE